MLGPDAPVLSSPPAGRASAWTGRLHMGGGHHVYLGPAGTSSAHAVHSVKVIVALDAPVRARVGAEPWRSVTSLVVPSEAALAVDGGGAPLALLAIAPELVRGPGAPRRLMVPRSGSLPAATEAWVRAAARDAPRGGFEGIEVERLVAHAIAGLGDAGVLAPIDRRILRALDWLVHEPQGAVPRDELARRVGLSPGRLTHLFQEETGTSLRSYQLWLRGRDALRRFGASSSLTEVAHAAGFADAAHLSRTAKRMLGVTASHLRHHATFERHCGPVPRPCRRAP